MFTRLIPVIMVLIASMITILVSIFNDFEIIFSLKILTIVIIIFYIIGNIVKLLVKKILTRDMEVTDSSMQEERAEKDDITAEKSGDSDSEVQWIHRRAR